MEDYNISPNRLLVYHVPVDDYGEILIDIRSVPFYDYDHVIINLVAGGIRNAPNDPPIVAMDVRHIGRRLRRLRRRRRFLPQNGYHDRRFYIPRNVQFINPVFARPLNDEELVEEEGDITLQQAAEDAGQDAAAQRAIPQQVFMNRVRAPPGNRVFFQDYFVNERQESNGFMYRHQQFAANGEQVPMEHDGEQNPIGQRDVARFVLAGVGQAAAREHNGLQNGIGRQGPSGVQNNNANAAGFGGQASRGRVVVQNMQEQGDQNFGRPNVSVYNAEDNGDPDIDSDTRKTDVTSTTAGKSNEEDNLRRRDDGSGSSTSAGAGSLLP